MSDRKLALVTGVGPGTGQAVVRRLVAGGYQVAMVARNADRLAGIASALPGSYAYPADVTDAGQLDQALDRIGAELGQPQVLVHNAVGGTFGNFLEIDPKVLETNFQTNVMALLHLA